MEERIDPIKKVIAWSDGNSRFVFMLLSTIDQAINVEWHYNEAHLGKGPMDGVGGTIKNLVLPAVKSGNVSVRDPEEFAKSTNDIVTYIHANREYVGRTCGSSEVAYVIHEKTLQNIVI